MKIVVKSKVFKTKCYALIDDFLKESDQYNVDFVSIECSRFSTTHRGIIYMIVAVDTIGKVYTLRCYTSNFVPRYHRFGAGNYIEHEYYFATLSNCVKLLLTHKGELYKI